MGCKTSIHLLDRTYLGVGVCNSLAYLHFNLMRYVDYDAIVFT